MSKFLKTPFGSPKEFVTSEISEFSKFKENAHTWLSNAKKQFTKANNFFQIGPISQTIKEVREERVLLLIAITF